MNTDIKSLIPSMHAELKRMQSRVAELQVSLQQGSSDEKAIREEISRMNLRQVEIMDTMVEIQEYILGKQEALLALLRERKSLLTAKEALEKKNKEWLRCGSPWIAHQTCKPKDYHRTVHVFQ